MIPKIIHYCWIGNKPLPHLAKKCIASWQRVMPDYEIKRWDETNYDFKKNKFMQNAYKQKKWAFVSDYMRLDVIYNYGGIYLDTDVEVLKPFDEFLKYPAFCGFESEHFVASGLGFGAQKGNGIIKQLMYPYETLDFKINDKILKDILALFGKKQIEKWHKEGGMPCPILETQILIEKYGLKQNNTRQSLNGMEVFPSLYFAPKDKYGIPIKDKNAYSIHHYMGSWNPKLGKMKWQIVIFLRRVLGNKIVDFLLLIKNKITSLFK